jgi:hypothetical protein
LKDVLQFTEIDLSPEDRMKIDVLSVSS